MTLVTFAKTPNHDIGLLSDRVKRAFPNAENKQYFDEIFARKNQDSVKESLSALLLLSYLLLQYDVKNSSLILKRGENGKPYFLNSSLHFSLSHSNGYAAAAISDLCEVGLDVETSDISPEQAKKLARRFFGADELAEFEGTPESFLRIWTKKEAYAKMRGIPLSELIASEKGGIGTEREKVKFYYLEADGHPITLCSEGDFDTVHLLETSIEEIIQRR